MIMTTLSDYLASRNETQTAFAQRAGLTDATLSRVMSGKTPPSPDVVEKVHAASEGAVTANDLFEAWRLARSTRPVSTGVRETSAAAPAGPGEAP